MKFIILVFTFLIVSHAFAEEETVNTFSDHHPVRLVAVQRSQRASQHLNAVFESLSKKEGLKDKKIAVMFPAHSHTPHEATIINLLSSFYAENAYDPSDPYLEVIFMIPREQIEKGFGGPFDKWYLREIKPKQNKIVESTPGS